jgi:hypothetical protein
MVGLGGAKCPKNGQQDRIFSAKFSKKNLGTIFSFKKGLGLRFFGEFFLFFHNDQKLAFKCFKLRRHRLLFYGPQQPAGAGCCATFRGSLALGPALTRRSAGCRRHRSTSLGRPPRNRQQPKPVF